ncbi:androgen-induced gene 1 protein isoform X1 [Harpia harpyja]|uniref:androgen-induced gene 1 protein isoform X1 n=1 Tax=Harpia harpyja TaxID=202280 RepID=UPI0022B0F412|nr:androgen-induced gene 1 protein isoform X1 [Harpia harpyja]
MSCSFWPTRGVHLRQVQVRESDTKNVGQHNLPDPVSFGCKSNEPTKRKMFHFTFLHKGPDLEQSRACWPAGKHQVIQAVFFGICVLTDLSSLLTKGNDSQEQERQLKKLISLRDWVMAVLAFPVGVFVVTMFWSIYIYDRELVYPKLLDNFIPAWLNHGMHTTVLPFVLIEMRTTHHQYPSRSCGLAAVCTFAVGYILWVCWIHHVTGVWVYPLLEHLSPGVKIIFFAAVTVIINIFYLVGEVLNNYIWDTQKCIEEGKEKPKLD